ncbi:MAG: GAF domain-containing protein, partial [Gemmatimonadetes bacterium]|nr:GAF domain-containing protein [Gemmatimonadota bacterium]NNF04210.1 GAF domain-containing protein [Rhodothermales bacterium]
GVIWSGTTGGGLQRYDARSGEVRRYRPSPGDPTTNPFAVAHIIEASDGALWIGSMDAGLVRFDRDTETFERFSYDPTDSTGISGNHVETVLERASQPGILWVTTQGGGLNRFDMETRTFRHFGPAEGLANTTVYGLLEDDEGMLWMSTNGGIFSFDVETETFRNYGTDDGLRELEFMQNGYTTGRGGMLYFGDVSGITAFSPSRLNVNTAAPDVAFTALRVDGRPVRAGSDLLEGSLADSAALKVPYGQNSFSVDFVGLHFSNPTKNHYSYLLDGYDDEWSEPSFQRTAAYTNLPPGEFTLRVRSANPDGVWNESGATLGVTVLPPWYRTTWAYILFAVLLGAAIFGADRFQRRRLLKRERARAELQEIELRAEAAESEAKALAAENERKKNIERLSDIGQEITASLDFETIFDRVYVHINELTDAPIFGVGVWRSDRNQIDYRLAMEEGKKYEPYTRDASDKNQFPVWCIEHKEAVFINDVETEYSKYIDSYDEQGATLEDGTTSRRPQSLIYLPLVSKDEVLGVITVQSFEKNAYTQNDLNLLKTMAAYSSVAMDNANAYRKLNSTIDELRQMQQQLVQQEKMASLGQLTAGIAHEIKNPLNFVTNFADLNSEMATELREILEGGDAASIAAKHHEIEDLIASLQMNAKQIAKHGRRADSIVRGMMEHARPGDAERFDVAINGFVDEYVNLAWHGYRARHPELQVDINRRYDDSVGNASIAPQDMGRVLINLIGNALDVLRDEENAALSVSTARRNGSVEIRIVDNGPGIPNDLRAKIFEPFFTTKS